MESLYSNVLYKSYKITKLWHTLQFFDNTDIEIINDKMEQKKRQEKKEKKKQQAEVIRWIVFVSPRDGRRRRKGQCAFT